MKAYAISFIAGFITAFAWVRYVVKQTFEPLLEEFETSI
jgi:hypothetical protein